MHIIQNQLQLVGRRRGFGNFQLELLVPDGVLGRAVDCGFGSGGVDALENADGCFGGGYGRFVEEGYYV